jgi:catechol 2,3-dioxygenase-like lactoylglutathione lyase family enzyme
MDWKIELIGVPVTDVERAKEFYGDRLGFVCDMDTRVSDDVRFVQFTPPGSACSIAFGEGITSMAPGSLEGIQVVVANADDALAQLRAAGVEARGVEEFPWGRFVFFTDPDGNGWALQQLVRYQDAGATTDGVAARA